MSRVVAPSVINPKEVSFIVTSGDPATDLTGGVYMKVYNNLTTNKNGENVYGAADAVKSYDSSTQVTYNKNSGILQVTSMLVVLQLRVLAA